ncbi:hypothetical protein [Nostoc sp.]|uniref:hypothetical protein n=1 Tax=Nostoc sp. TaxID=1180 RepID=UPI002FFCF070
MTSRYSPISDLRYVHTLLKHQLIFLTPTLIQTPRWYVTSLEEIILSKNLELEEILNFQVAIIDYSPPHSPRSSAALSLLVPRLYLLSNVDKKLIVFS